MSGSERVGRVHTCQAGSGRDKKRDTCIMLVQCTPKNCLVVNDSKHLLKTHSKHLLKVGQSGEGNKGLWDRRAKKCAVAETSGFAFRVGVCLKVAGCSVGGTSPKLHKQSLPWVTIARGRGNVTWRLARPFLDPLFHLLETY